MRLFIAIDLPGSAKSRLGELQDPGLDVRWSSDETMHLTLRFIGDVDDSKRSRLFHTLSNIDHPSFNLQISGTGYFPRGKTPKIIWAGVRKNDLLMQLQEKIERACRSAALEPEERTFRPHITLGRVSGAPRNEVLTFINRNKKLRVDDIPIREFILYESRLKPEGAVHTPLERYSL